MDDNDSTGDVEECERKPKTGLFDSIIFVLLAMLFCLLTVEVRFE